MLTIYAAVSTGRCWPAPAVCDRTVGGLPHQLYKGREGEGASIILETLPSFSISTKPILLYQSEATRLHIKTCKYSGFCKELDNDINLAIASLPIDLFCIPGTIQSILSHTRSGSTSQCTNPHRLPSRITI
ncbi:hypothetical protein BN2476_500015 [Paraburkholderia piptadeniae]|uniref:Uncharacterized protein n=1 Tax=Paraburkholderia piptadeniae TaxID=1701573 RepID=A0A1N7SF76_9BURK|nr:hypothetical protein BN2476_500015 [Paraburkholderia piptadeniae]